MHLDNSSKQMDQCQQLQAIWSKGMLRSLKPAESASSWPRGTIGITNYWRTTQCDTKLL